MSFCDVIHSYSVSDMLIHFNSIGMGLNMLCIVGLFFSFDLINSKNNLFKYLFFKSISNMIYLLNNMITYFYFNCTSCIVYRIYDLCEYGFKFNLYIGCILPLFSMLCQIAANFDRYKMITNRFEIFNKVSFKLKLGAIFGLSCAYYIYWFFLFDCEPYQIDQKTNKTSTFYPVANEFYNSTFFYALDITGRFITDLLSSFMLIILNIITLFFMRHSLRNKKLLTPYNSSSSSISVIKRRQVINAERAQTRTTQMVLMTSLITLVGHVPWFIERFFFNKCLYGISAILYSMSYSIDFIIFVLFLRKFRIFYKQLIVKIIEYASCKRIKFASKNNELEFDEIKAANQHQDNENINNNNINEDERDINKMQSVQLI